MFRKLLFLVVMLGVIGCSKKSEEIPSVLFLHYFTGNLSAGIDNLTEVINSNQDDFNLIATPLEHEEFKVSIRLQLENQNSPDLFSYWAGARTKYLLDNNKLEPITDIFNGVIKRDSFDQSIISACSYDEEIYMLPLTRHYVGFFYNKRVFDSLNLDEPETWEELITISKLLKKEGITPFALGAKNRWPAQFWFDYLLLRTNGYEYREGLMDNMNSYVDEAVIDVMEIWKGLLDEEFFSELKLDSDWDDAALEVATGEAAMTLMGTWTIPLFESQELVANKDYGFFPFPTINDEISMVSLGPIDGILMSKGGKISELSRKVLYHFAQEKTQEVFNSDSGAIAPYLGVDDDVYNPIQLEIKDLIKLSEHWAFNYDLATTPVVSEAGLDLFVNFIEEPDRFRELLIELEEGIDR